MKDTKHSAAKSLRNRIGTDSLPEDRQIRLADLEAVRRRRPPRTSFIKQSSRIQYVSDEKLPLDKLLQLCLQSGGETLWAEFIRRSHTTIAGVVVKTVLRRTKATPSLVDDLVQETYLKLCLDDFKALRRPVFGNENSVFAFLKVVACNVARDHFRAANSRKRGSGIADVQLDHVPLTAVLSHSAPAGDRCILLETIDSCLQTSAGDSNSARDRMIFWLYYREGLTAKAISNLPLIRLSVKGVESILLRLIRLVKLTLDSRRERSPNRCAT